MGWYEDKVESIRKRKRKLHYITEPKVRKKIISELKIEQRAAKKSERHHLREWIKNEIDGLNND